MAKIIKVRCNGAGKHINEVDIEKLIKPPVVVLRGKSKAGVQERYVLGCQHCPEGRVIVTREMIESV